MSIRVVLGRRIAGIALFSLALAASGLAGAPSTELPEIALGWPLLLHIERAAATVGIIGFALLVIWRAGRGDFPIRFANIEYEARSVASEMKRGVELLELRTEQIEQELEMLETQVADFQERG